MPKAKKAVPAAEAQPRTAQDKVAGCLALLATKGMDTDDAALKLDGISFTAREIAGLLDVGENYVNVARHRKNRTAERDGPKPAKRDVSRQS